MSELEQLEKHIRDNKLSITIDMYTYCDMIWHMLQFTEKIEELTLTDNEKAIAIISFSRGLDTILQFPDIEKLPTFNRSKIDKLMAEIYKINHDDIDLAERWRRLKNYLWKEYNENCIGHGFD